MKRKILGIFMSLLMLATCIGPTIFTENESNAKATAITEGNVGLDYDTIYEKLRNLSYIVFDKGLALDENGIYKGRDFGTDGDREAARRIQNWMENFSTNLTDSYVVKEAIGYDNGGVDIWSPHKSDILGFSLQLRYETNEPIIISANESFPIVPPAFGKNPSRSCDLALVKPISDQYNYGYSTFNVSYIKINDSENFSDLGLNDELVYIENYSNASAADIEGRVHLLNISDNELNNTLNQITNANASGFILIRNDSSYIQGWELPLPGIAVSQENGSLIKSYIQNESLFNVSVAISTFPTPDQGNLEIYYFNDSCLNPNKIMLLVDQDNESQTVKALIWARCLRVVGLLYYHGSPIYDTLTHSENVPSYLEPKFFFGLSLGTKISMKRQFVFSSRLVNPKPIFYINRSIFLGNGESVYIDQWVASNQDKIKASFTLNWHKNESVESYNVYCTVPGKDTSKTVILSGGHFDGFWGQMSTDNAAGVAVMFGILKYMNDYHITPKCNLVFITFSGEEYIDKGSRGYVLRHWDDIEPSKIECILNFDVLAHDIDDSKLYIHSYNRFDFLETLKTNSIVTEIAEQTNYYERNHHNYSLITAMPTKRCLNPFANTTEEIYPGTDAFPFWLRGITAINFGKEKYDEIRHQTGTNHTLGDNMAHIDKTDLEVSSDLIWNVSKYFSVDPDCRFEDITYQTWDSTDNNDLNDSVNITFSVNTSLPQDRIWVKATLISQDYPILCRYKEQQYYVVTPTGIQDTLTITLPERAPQGNYILQVFLYNSTGIVDRKIITLFDYLDFGIYANEKYKPPEEFFLYPPNDPPETPHQPWGDDNVLTSNPYDYTTHTTDPNDDPIWYQWKFETNFLGLGRFTYYTRWIMGGPKASGENITKPIQWSYAGIYNVSVRAKDNILNPNVMSNWSEPKQVTVTYSDDAAPWNTDLLGMFTSTMVAIDQQTSCQGLAAGVIMENTQRGSLNWTWDFGDGRICYGENVSHSYREKGNYIVNLTLRNTEGITSNYTTMISVDVLRADFNTIGDEQPNKTVYFTDTSSGSYQLVNWTWDFGDGNVSYDRNTSHMYAQTREYNVTLTVKDIEDNIHEYMKPVYIESLAPDFISVIDTPDPVGYGNNVTISVDFFDNQSGVESVIVNITYPDNTTGNFTMEQNVSSEHDYQYVFNDTWQNGVYNYSIYVVDHANNTNCSSGFDFTASAEATITVTTTKNSYSGNEYINLTDPPGNPLPSLGYELLNNDTVLHLWNQYDNYYFNTSSGIQLTNHYDAYWSQNVLMLGYYTNDQWNLIYRTDELSGFNKNIETDGINSVNVTLWKDLTYSGYSFRLAIRYHLGINDRELTVIPYIKNLGVAIPYTLGFAWEINDIQVAMTPENDYLDINGTRLPLNQSIDVTYKQLSDPVFSINEDLPDGVTESLSLRWSETLNYLVWVKSRVGEYNAPVMLGIKIGPLSIGQEKYTELLWHDASQMTYYFNNHNPTEIWATEPDNMVDGSISKYASTTIQNDVELCDRNSCNGTSLGTISKVEFRAYGYCSNGHRDIILQPVFNGQYHGSNYSYSPSSTPAWSGWFDITNDSGHLRYGSWNWSQIRDLDCDVTSQYIQSGGVFTLLCSKVDLRVTYNNAPVISNPSPPHGTNGVSLQPWLNITIADPNGDTMNLTWYSNSTSSFLSLRPNANGSTTQLERYPTSQNANYKCIDDTITNDSDYVKWKGSSWKKDTYNLPNHTNQSGTIHDVTVYARCARVGSVTTPTTTSSAKIVIRSGGTDYYGTEFKPPHSMWPPITYTNYFYTWKNNPATGNAWSWTDIDNLQAGVTFIGNEGTSECTQLYVVVNYTNPNTWLQFGRNSSVNNGTYRQQFLNASMNGEWWYWKVNADDGTLSTWSSVYKFYTGYQSKIENCGDTNFSGYLLIQVQFYNTSQAKWLVDNDTINETSPRTITNGNQLALDIIFNGHVRASDLTHGTGTYRVYTAFRDPEGNILKTNDDVDLEAWWQFNKT